MGHTHGFIRGRVRCRECRDQGFTMLYIPHAKREVVWSSAKCVKLDLSLNFCLLLIIGVYRFVYKLRNRP